MGTLHFLIPDKIRLTGREVENAYLAGSDGVPHRRQISVTEDGFRLSREIDEAGQLYLAWPVGDRARLVLCTASLMPRETPYLLPLELARGTLNRLRNQRANWEQAGLVISEVTKETIQQATKCFTRAATSQRDLLASSVEAEKAIELGLAAIRFLVDDFIDQAIPLRQQGEQGMNVVLVVGVEDRPTLESELKSLCSTFKFGAVGCDWSSIETAAGERRWESTDQQVKLLREAGMRVMGGPLLELSAERMPAWLGFWEGDFQNIEMHVREQVAAVVERYRGEVSVWNVLTGLKGSGLLSLSEEEELQLAVTTLEVVKQCDPEATLMVTFDQPWGEYLATQSVDLPPMHIADAIARANLGMAAIGLGVNLSVGERAGEMASRDLLEVSRQIDGWSQLELPLIIQLTMLGNHEQGNDEALAEQVEKTVGMLLAKQAVQAVVWKGRGEDSLVLSSFEKLAEKWLK